MKPAEFWHEYSFTDFQRKMVYFFKSKADNTKEHWEQVRQIVFVTAAVHGAKESAQELMPFSWDKKSRKATKRAKPMSSGEIDGILKRYNLTN